MSTAFDVAQKDSIVQQAGTLGNTNFSVRSHWEDVGTGTEVAEWRSWVRMAKFLILRSMSCAALYVSCMFPVSADDTICKCCHCYTSEWSTVSSQKKASLCYAYSTRLGWACLLQGGWEHQRRITLEDLLLTIHIWLSPDFLPGGVNMSGHWLGLKMSSNLG